jgi:hypothetical protein
MPEARPEHNNEQPAQVQEPAKMPAPPERKPAAGRGTPGHGGTFADMRGLLASSDGQEPPPERFAPIFRSAEIAAPVNEAQKARALGVLQQQFGNRYVQRVLAPAAPAQPGALVQRQANPSAPDSADAAPIPTSAGQPLDRGTQNQMGTRFGQDFGGVRVHTDSQAHQAARNLGAEAFTTGRDIYFSRGAYDPGSEGGRGLLAHELTHVVQQGRGAAGAAPQGFHISQPDDPLEREAESVSAAVMRGELFPPIAAAPPLVQRQADAAPARSAPAPTPAGPGVQPAEARPGDYPITIAGMPIVLKIGKLIDRAAPGGKLAVPDTILKHVPAIPAFKLTDASIDLDENKMPAGASASVALNIPPVEGQGTLSVDRQGNATGSVRAVFRSNKIPGLKETEIDARVGKDDFAFDAGIEFDFPKISGRLDYKYQGKKHSGKGKASYEGAKLKGTIEIILSEAGLLSGSGQLEMELFKGLRGMIDVDVDEKRSVKVKGKLQVPGQIELFPEKKYEKSFFNFEKKFPLWGITVPVVDINVGLFAEVHAGAGFRSKFGPGVLRNIELTGEFGSDPEAATELGLGGEFFVPAGAEIVINAGGGIGLGLAIADITGGIEAVGVAGLYAALTVRPQFKYSGGKYSISGMAELAGVAQAKFGINAFAKIDVGVWMFKGTVWRKDWTLAEWVWNMGLNVALRANINYTLGDDFAPDISFETGQVDPEKFVKDVMPESGSPVPAPPKPPVPDKGTFTAEGVTGTQAGGAPGEAPAPPTPGTPATTTKPGQAPAGAGAAGAPDLSHEERWKAGVGGVKLEIDQLEQGEVDEEILRTHLPTWREKFGFTQLTVKTVEQEWVVEGAMSAAAPVDKVPRKTIKPKGDGKDYQRILKGQLLDLSDFMNPEGTRLRIDPDYVSPKDPKGRSNAERAKDGLTSILPSGDRVELHHADQDFFSQLDEHSASFHQGVLDDPDFHPFTGDPGYLSWRGEVAMHSGKMKTLGDIYNSIRGKYWRRRF